MWFLLHATVHWGQTADTCIQTRWSRHFTPGEKKNSHFNTPICSKLSRRCAHAATSNERDLNNSLNSLSVRSGSQRPAKVEATKTHPLCGFVGRTVGEFQLSIVGTYRRRQTVAEADCLLCPLNSIRRRHCRRRATEWHITDRPASCTMALHGSGRPKYWQPVLGSNALQK